MTKNKKIGLIVAGSLIYALCIYLGTSFLGSYNSAKQECLNSAGYSTTEILPAKG